MTTEHRALLREFADFLEPMRFGRESDDSRAAELDKRARALLATTTAADCYHRAEPDEPKFTLLGRDPHAAVLVNLWAVMRRIEGDPDDMAKIESAEALANEMALWTTTRCSRDPVGAAGLAVAVAVFAEMVGAVITMTQQSLEPLAMGNYRHTVSVRAKREAAEPMVRVDAL